MSKVATAATRSRECRTMDVAELSLSAKQSISHHHLPVMIPPAIKMHPQIHNAPGALYLAELTAGTTLG